MGDVIDLNRDSVQELSRWLGDYFAWKEDHPQLKEILEYIETIYHWQTMNTLIHQFGLQKYDEKYIFNYTSWNHDIKCSYVFLESEFRRYLRLAWAGKIPTIKGE
jgi:hypothetical protein